MKTEVKMRECPECQGEGTVFYDTSHACGRPMSDCCGGCGADIQCEDCKGEGAIIDETEDDAFYLLNQLQQSGETNMTETTPQIKEWFPHLTQQESEQILSNWVKSQK